MTKDQETAWQEGEIKFREQLTQIATLVGDTPETLSFDQSMNSYVEIHADGQISSGSGILPTENFKWFVRMYEEEMNRRSILVFDELRSMYERKLPASLIAPPLHEAELILAQARDAVLIYMDQLHQKLLKRTRE